MAAPRRLQSLLVTTLSALLMGQASAAECDAGSNTTFKALPRLIPEFASGATMWTQVTFGTETFVVKEVVDMSKKTALLEYVNSTAHTVQNILVNWSENNTYLFSYNDQACDVAPLYSDQAKELYSAVPFIRVLEIDELPAQPGFLGASMLFDRFIGATNAAERDQFTGEQAECKIDRVIPCKHFRQCAGFANSEQYDFYFSQDDLEMFDRRESLPLRLEFKGVTVEVMSIRLAKQSADLFAPTGLGCQPGSGGGNKTEQKLTIPKVDKFEFEGEVVLEGADLAKTYVSSLSGLWLPSFGQGHEADHGHEHDHDGLPGIFSFTYATWQQQQSAAVNDTNNQTTTDEFKAAWKERVIYDTDHSMYSLHSYKPDQSLDGAYQTKCELMERRTDYRATLTLPKIGDIELEPLFLRPPDASTPNASIAYLGPNKVDTIDTYVFEVTYDNYYTGMATFEKFVVTYHLSYDLKSPVALVLNAYRGDGELTKAFTVSIRVIKATSEVHAANEKLGIDDCYVSPDKAAFHWFQIGFNIEATQQMKASKQLTYLANAQRALKENVLLELYNRYDLLPMRIPYASVDFFEEQILVNVLLLESPGIQYSFDEFVAKDINQPTQQLGIMSENSCRAACLALRGKDCTAVSYCGSSCALTKANDPKSDAKEDMTCVLHVRNTTHTVPVSANVLGKIKKAVEAKNKMDKLQVQFNLVVDSGHIDTLGVVLTADSYDDTKDFESAFHFQKNQVAVLETAFKIAKAKARFGDENGGQNGFKKLGSLPIEDCAVACRNRPDCETFSYCDNSGDCVISPSHAVADDATTEDNFCVVYQATYVDRFDLYPGRTIKSTGTREMQAADADSCADQCLKDTGCKSFDFCQVTKSCIMHSTHITETDGAATVEPECSHFSKKFLYDYSKQLNSHGAEGDVLMIIANETETACAKRCTEWSNPETPCLSFDFCGRLNSNEGECTLRSMSGQGKVAPAPVCDFYYFTAPKPVVQNRHGAGAAICMSVLMICIGVGVGIAGVVGYNKYRGV